MDITEKSIQEIYSNLFLKGQQYALKKLKELHNSDQESRKIFFDKINAHKFHNQYAQYILGFMYTNGYAVEKDYTEAYKWYKLSADQNNSYAQNCLGFMYDLGEGMNRDIKKAFKWYKMSADLNNPFALNNLALIYNGDGVHKDHDEALRLFKLSVSQGNSQAHYNLGLIYENGSGVNKSLKEAFKWYKMGADLGDEESREKLESLLKNHQDEVIELMINLSKENEQLTNNDSNYKESPVYVI